MATDKILELSKRCKDLTGQQFGRLIVERFVGRNKYGQTLWSCTCSCGNKISVLGYSLLSGHTRSCSCLQKDIISKKRLTHGLSDAVEYSIWCNMIQRCENPKHPEFKRYGARGILVCSCWRNSFEAFYEDIGSCPSGKTLDRWPDNNGNYEPGNWRWATPKEQANNRRSMSCGLCRQRWFRAWHKDSMAQFISNNQCKFARQYGLNQSNISSCLSGKYSQIRDWSFCWIF